MIYWNKKKLHTGLSVRYAVIFSSLYFCSLGLQGCIAKFEMMAQGGNDRQCRVKTFLFGINHYVNKHVRQLYGHFVVHKAKSSWHLYG